jgi:uncharacterized OsmC-like protein
MTETATISAHTVLNGVDATALLETLDALKAQPALAKFQFRVANKWQGGSHNRSTIKGFYGAGREDDTRAKPYTFDNGEPTVLLGHEEGANPVEYLLHGLAGCMTTTMAYHAAAQGIAIEALESRVEGDIDIRGFTGVAPDVPKGFGAIRVTFRAKTKGDAALLESLTRMSPVYNTIAGSVPVTVRVDTY